MRNVVEYPITPQECIDWLENIRPQFSYETTGRIGDMSGMIIDFIEKALIEQMIRDAAFK